MRSIQFCVHFWMVESTVPQWFNIVGFIWGLHTHRDPCVCACEWMNSWLLFLFLFFSFLVSCSIINSFVLFEWARVFETKTHNIVLSENLRKNQPDKQTGIIFEQNSIFHVNFPCRQLRRSNCMCNIVVVVCVCVSVYKSKSIVVAVFSSNQKAFFVNFIMIQAYCNFPYHAIINKQTN